MRNTSIACPPWHWPRKMKFLVRPEFPTAALRSSQATHAAVENSAPFAIRPVSTYLSGNVVQKRGATSVPPRPVHSVAIVIRASQRSAVKHTHEPWQPTLIRAVRAALGVGCRYKKHRAFLDESAVVIRKCCSDNHGLQSVGQSSGVAGILKLPHSIVLHRIFSHGSPFNVRVNGIRFSSKLFRQHDA